GRTQKADSRQISRKHGALSIGVIDLDVLDAGQDPAQPVEERVGILRWRLWNDNPFARSWSGCRSCRSLWLLGQADVFVERVHVQYGIEPVRGRVLDRVSKVEAVDAGQCKRCFLPVKIARIGVARF